MKSTSATLIKTIRSDYTNYVTPKLTAEWNLNRYFPTTVTNTPDEDTDGNDIEIFDISSIALPNRPSRGINKAFTNQAKTTASYTDKVDNSRFYLASKDSQYKYWRSPYAATTSPYSIPQANGDTTCQPTVIYTAVNGVLPTTNKIVVKFETSITTPTTFSVLVRQNGSWTAIANQATASIDSTGKYIIWYDGNSWSNTQDLTHGTTIDGVRVKVTGLNKAGYLDLIEISARLEQDLTADFISGNDTATMGEPDYITPMGDISSNDGSLSLMNENRVYSNQNTSSRYTNIMDKNVRFVLDYIYTTSAGSETVRQFTLYSDSWEEDEEAGTVSVSLADFSRFYQEKKPAPILYQNVSVQEAVWRLCDLVGINNYQVSVLPDIAYHMIDIFWTDGTQTLWEVFGELAKAAQAAIYFDSYGVLQIKTREAAFDNTKTPVWNLRQNASGTELPDIISFATNSDYEANKITVEVQPTAFLQQKQGMDVFNTVWEPDGDVTLRSNSLVKSMDATTMTGQIWLEDKDAADWPYSGIVDIEGEFIKYEGKQFKYYDGTVLKYTSVKSQAEQAKLRAKANSAYTNQCGLTGGLTIKERGYWNSVPAAHNIDVNGWTTAARPAGGSVKSPANGWKQDKTASIVTGDAGSVVTKNDFTYFVHGNGIDEGFKWLGTSLRINAGGHRDKLAGMFFNSEAIGAGYFIEVVPTDVASTDTNIRNELVLYSVKTDGSIKLFGGQISNYSDPGKTDSSGTTATLSDVGAEALVYTGVWGEIDVAFQVQGNGDHRIIVAWNGSDVLDATIPQGSGWQHPNVSRSGLFLRGQSSADFNYFYGITKLDIPKGEASPFYDRIQGSWYAQQWQRDWTYETKTIKVRRKKKWTKVKKKFDQRFFDEFGPMVHEVREFDVKFTNDGNLPVVQSKLFSTSNENFVAMDFQGGPFGAKFTIANTARRNVVINGDDPLANPAADTPPHNTFFVWGRNVIQKPALNIRRSNDLAIAKRGEIETTFSSKWIQSYEVGVQLAEWIVSQWSATAQQLDVTIFGNPLIELTDVVGVQHEEMNTTTHQYFVTAIDSTWDNGVQTKLTLRRKIV